MSDNNIDRDALAHRIRALLAKTVENGATEAEALAAAAKARQLMDAHRLTQSDIEIQAEPIADEIMDRANPKKISAVDLALGGIGAYCGIRYWFGTTVLGNRRVHMVGLQSDVAMARYLYAMIHAAIKAEAARYLHDTRGYPPSSSRSRSHAFQIGMGHRIGRRLHEMARALEPVAKTSSGTALVVVKGALVNEAYARITAGFKWSNARSRTTYNDRNAYAAGQEAGDRVNLSRPVEGAAQRRLA